MSFYLEGNKRWVAISSNRSFQDWISEKSRAISWNILRRVEPQMIAGRVGWKQSTKGDEKYPDIMHKLVNWHQFQRCVEARVAIYIGFHGAAKQKPMIFISKWAVTGQLYFFFVVFAGKRHVTTRLASGTQLLKAQHLSANKFGERAFIFDESNVCTEHIGNCFRVLMKLQKIFRDGCSTRGSACSRSSARFSGPSKSTSAIPVSSSS